MTIITIDFEASCLPRHGRSYPIEVGIAGLWEGAFATRNWLIRPHNDWRGWGWTACAEALHGLSHQRIGQEGVDARQVLDELLTVADGHRLVADSLIDQYWLDTLAVAAGRRAVPAIDHISIVMEELRADEARIARALDHANALVRTRHRAAADAEWLAAVIDDLGGQIGSPDWRMSRFTLND